MQEYNLNETLEALVRDIILEEQERNYEQIREQMITVIDSLCNKELNLQQVSMVDEFMESYTKFIIMSSVNSVVNLLKTIGQDTLNSKK